MFDSFEPFSFPFAVSLFKSTWKQETTHLHPTTTPPSSDKFCISLDPHSFAPKPGKMPAPTW